MNNNRNNKLTAGFGKTEPLANHFDRPFGLAHIYEEIRTLKEQFARNHSNLVAQEIKKLLEVTEDFIVKTDSSTQELRAGNPNTRRIIEKAINAYKNLFENIKNQLASVANPEEKNILEEALKYSKDAINKRLMQLNTNHDLAYEYTKPAFAEIFSERESNHLDLNH